MSGLSTTSGEGSYINTKGLACDQHAPWGGIQEEIKRGIGSRDSRRRNTFFAVHTCNYGQVIRLFKRIQLSLVMSLPPMWTAPRIKQTVYVDVPEPPYPLSIFPPLKEDKSRVLTRKRVSEHHAPPLPKKPKVATSKPLVLSQPVTQPTSNASPENSKDYIHCHQCSQKRDMAGAS